VVRDLVAPVAIIAVASPAGLLLVVVATDQLAQALEALKMRRTLSVMLASRRPIRSAMARMPTATARTTSNHKKFA